MKTQLARLLAPQIFLPALIASFTTSLPTHAAGETRLLEEITVTAQKRTERLQNVPISMSVVSMQAINELNLFDFEDLSELIPGSTLNRGLQSGSIRLRGVGPSAFTVNAPESVAVFVDQYPQSRAGAVFATLHDVERVAVLRGPQGTLYGQNAQVGVYNITTRKPDTRAVEGNVQTSYAQYDADSDRATFDVRGAVNLPLVKDTLALRVSALHRDADGFAKAKNPLASFDAAGGRDVVAGRAHLLWEAGPRSQLLWTMNAQDITGYPISGNLDGQVPGTGGASDLSAQFARFEDRAYWGETRGTLEGSLADTGVHYTYDSEAARYEVLASLQSFETDAAQNRRAFVGGSDNFFFTADYEIASLELRTSSENERFDYVAGLFVYDKAVTVDVDLDLGSTRVLSGGKESTETWAAFGNINYHLGKQWDFAVGLRWDNNDVAANYLAGFDGLSPVALNDKSNFEYIAWSASLRWYPAETTTAYLSLDNATKQGGYNPLVSAAETFAAEFPEVATVAADNLRYDEEQTTALEFGIKGRSADNTLRYTVAAFYQYFDNYQLTHQGNRDVLDPAGDLFTNVVTNAEEVATRGLELGATVLAGKRWTLTHRLAYFDTEIAKWNKRFCVGGESVSSSQIYCGVTDQPLNDLPKWGANTRLRYEFPWRGLKLYSSINWSWRSRVDEARLTDDFRTDKHRFSFFVGARSPRRGADLQFWVRNFTNADLNQSPGVVRNGDRTQPDAWRGNYSRGREYGVKLGYRF